VFSHACSSTSILWSLTFIEKKMCVDRLVNRIILELFGLLLFYSFGVLVGEFRN